MSQLSEALTETIKDDNFQGVIADLSETGLDAVLKEGVLRDLPFIGSIVGLAKAGVSVRDVLFMKKIQAFLYQLKNTNVEDRRKEIEKIDNDPSYKTKVGEKLLHIIDKCDDAEKAGYSGRLFRYYIDGKIDYENCLRAIKCIELTFLPDLKWFIETEYKTWDIADAGDLVGSGLMSVVYTAPGQNWNDVGGGSLKVEASSIGKLIKELLKDYQG